MLSATRNPKILICSPEQAWLLHRELGAMATQTSRILINWLLCKGRIYCAMHKEAVLKKRGTTVPVIKRQPQNTPASRRKWTLWHYRDATSLNKDRRKLFAERGKRGLKSQELSAPESCDDVLGISGEFHLILWNPGRVRRIRHSSSMSNGSSSTRKAIARLSLAGKTKQYQTHH